MARNSATWLMLLPLCSLWGACSPTPSDAPEGSPSEVGPGGSDGAAPSPGSEGPDSFRGSGAAHNSDDGNGGESATGPEDFVLIDTGSITHDRDYFPFQDREDPFVSETAPLNWLKPVAYAEGTMTLILDVSSVEVPDPQKTPEFYYTITWFHPDRDDDAGWLRPAIHVDAGPGHYESTFPVKDLEWVGPEGSRGRVGDQWDWSKAFRNIAGDLVAWPNAAFPITVKVKMIVHSPR